MEPECSWLSSEEPITHPDSESGQTFLHATQIMEVQLEDISGGRMNKFERRINSLQRSIGSDMKIGGKTNECRMFSDRERNRLQSSTAI